MVTCPSGRRCNSRKVVWVKAHRGFKSHRHRQFVIIGQKRALGRPNLVLEKSRVLSAEIEDLPGQGELRVKVSRFALFMGAVGGKSLEFEETLVLGTLRGSSQILRIKISHPGIDEIWVCGSQAKELGQQLNKFLKTAYF